MPSLKPYPSYRKTDLPWLEQIPAHWEAKPLFAVMKERQRKNIGNHEGNVLSLSYGNIIRRDVESNFGLLPESFETYQIVQPGNIILRLTDLQNDKRSLRTGQAKEKGIITSAYTCLEVSNRMDEKFAHYLFHGYDLLKVFYQLGGGVRQTMKFDDLKRLLVLVPSLKEQQAIAAYLDHQTAKIDALIAKKERLLELLREMRDTLTKNAMRSSGAQSLKLGEVADWVKRPINRQDEVHYEPIGLYNRGRGIFHKPINKGIDLGDSDFFEIKEGDFVISGQFAWEGAVALAQQEEDGCIASHRYYSLRGKPDRSETAYLFSFFTTQLGDNLLNHHSRGAAGRNRPLNINALLREKIPVPPLSMQKPIIALIEREFILKKQTQKLVELLREYRAALISSAVTGKIQI